MEYEYDLVIYNGQIVTPTHVLPPTVWIGIVGSKISTLSSNSPPPLDSCKRSIDAKGGYITPGGIDTHVHIQQLQVAPGQDTGDTFLSGTRSAIAGGTTTIISFANQQRHDTSLFPLVEEYHSRARGDCYCDYGFHVILTNPTERVLDTELPVLVEKEGITSVKIYMTYEARRLGDRAILEILVRARKLGITTMIHAENDDMIQLVIDHLSSHSLTEPHHHVQARPPLAESEATNRAISLGAFASSPILIVHVSSAAAMSAIQRAQANLQPVYAETCPQYLLLLADAMQQPEESGCPCACRGTDTGTDGSSEIPLRPSNFPEDASARDGFESAKLVCSPPLRETRDDLDSVWKGVRNGTVTTFSSDHSPQMYHHPMGKKKGLVDGGADFRKIPNGIPGLETRLPLLYTYSVQQRRITIQRFVEICCSQPARLYGLQHRKGEIAPGFDADLVVWYPDEAFTPVRVTNDMLHHNVDYTPFEGTQVTNWPRYTILRGKVAWDRDNGGVVGEKGSGEYVKRVRGTLADAVGQSESYLEKIEILAKGGKR